jgi:cell division protein FtsN
MAPKDYVKRPRASAKKQAKRRSTRNNASAPVAWIKVSISVAVVIMFAFALYTLQSLGTSEDDISHTNQELEFEEYTDTASEVDTRLMPENESLEQTELPELPVLGEEEWEYIDSLPDFSVEVDATEVLKKPKPSNMQCGSFRTKSRAEELKAKIAFQGLESRVLQSNGANGIWYRVVLGPYERVRLAESHRTLLRKGNIRGCKIW